MVAFSPAIVWDALVDPELVAGWLGEARIDPVIDGRYDLAWLVTPEVAATSGRIIALQAPTSLVVATDAHGTVEFSLTEVPGGPRSTSTIVGLSVTVEIGAPFEARVRQLWSDALAQLDLLLHGHPIDWGIVANVPAEDAADLAVEVGISSLPVSRRIRASHTNAIEIEIDP